MVRRNPKYYWHQRAEHFAQLAAIGLAFQVFKKTIERESKMRSIFGLAPIPINRKIKIYPIVAGALAATRFEGERGYDHPREHL